MPSFDQIRPLLAPWGALKPQPASDWNGPFALPEAIAEFYREVGPWGDLHDASDSPDGLSINTGGNPVSVPPLHKLWARQDGYAWSRNPANRLDGWPEHWLVIAQEGGLPFVFDRNDGSVLFHFTGMRHWNAPRRFAPDLATALGAIATVANALAKLGDDALDETFELKASSKVYVAEQLAAFTGSAEQAREMLAAWEWYE
ncbi:hypothetical protein NU688_14515 [Variovorax sp. ZS18.2.2]|uniref:hypothetical protein n=1 Tax=Variovorax sp. ZS18.2.2 TaxID=2971255 RepID=UPI002150E750|nr:hypothetical protein [Variovorax sp. ZS18.2.2]MCR6477371.1 hypothetical protein [Variovorax sp. ZS18.2.2]